MTSIGITSIPLSSFALQTTAGQRDKPPQNAFIESFNGSLRDELLNEELFDSLDDARRKLALW